MSDRLFYTRPASIWEEALPLGNGTLGAMVFGNPTHERVALNHDTLWSGHPAREVRPGAPASFRLAQEMALRGEYAEAMEELQANFLSHWTQCYLPMGELCIDFPERSSSDYSRGLDLSRGVASCAFVEGNAMTFREAFCSHPDNVFVYRLSADRPGRVSCRLRLLSALRPCVGSDERTFWVDGACPYDSATHEPHYPTGQTLYYYDDPERQGVHFRCAVRVLAKGGTVQYDDYGATLNGCDEATVLLAASTSFQDYQSAPDREYRDDCLRTLERAERPYSELITRHADDHGALYGRVKFTLEGASSDRLPTDERLAAHRDGAPDLGLYTLMFQYGRYLTIAASRPGSRAMNLQGIWNPHVAAPWNCNYTVNINTEMNYWPTLPSNLGECDEPLLALIRAAADTGRDTAKGFYDAPGWVCHHNTDLWAHTAPVRNLCVFAFWQGGSGWLCRQIWEHWLYTRDERFLREYLPILRGAAEFYDATLTDDGEGHLVPAPSTSPENAFRLNGQSVSTAKWTAMEVSIVRETFRNVIEASETLGETDALTQKLGADLARLPELAVGSKGQLLEWNEEFEETEPHHRHISHLYALHPARLIGLEDTALREAVKTSLTLRGDDGTGWSLGWKINQWARLRDGDHALRLMDMQLRPALQKTENYVGGGGTYPNLFDAHPPFQIDGNFAFTAGVCELLVQWEPGRLDLLPALPEAWATGSVRGLCAPGGLTIDMAWENGLLADLHIDGDLTGIEVYIRGQRFAEIE